MLFCLIFSLRRVFFHALSSTKEFEVSNKVLQNETWASSPHNFHDFKVYIVLVMNIIMLTKNWSDS